ncbi:conserved hypothetical protein [delta proteobacterium NaphS2]|nr:conserved hypothetical protein [delta proteobacterium NaphS2]
MGDREGLDAFPHLEGKASVSKLDFHGGYMIAGFEIRSTLEWDFYMKAVPGKFREPADQEI